MPESLQNRISAQSPQRRRLWKIPYPGCKIHVYNILHQRAGLRNCLLLGRLDFLSISTLGFVFFLATPILVSCALVMSRIYDISSQFQANMAKKVQTSKDKDNGTIQIWMRELRSCQLVRCQIGNFYHMEGKAKLTLVNTIVNAFVFMVVQRKVL
jgi:hypothetical protein